MLSTPRFLFALEPNQYASQPVPTLDEWNQLWASWDLLTRRMIPNDELLSRPIKLRNCCLFYLGHIPTFLDIHLARTTNGKPTEPSNYINIFERGIDPDVDNPEKCHTHSEIPETWPPVEDILLFQKHVRERTVTLYKDKSVEMNRGLGRALWLAFEHEAMHLETLLYMLLQSETPVAPPGMKPDFEALADQARASAVPNKWFRIPATQVSVGMNDPEGNEGPYRFFGWDNEKPVRKVNVPAFEAQARALTNGDYARYLMENGIDKYPVSWNTSTIRTEHFKKSKDPSTPQLTGYNANGDEKTFSVEFLQGKTVKTVYGPVPLAHALDWPVFASYNELAGCAIWMGGRIPTMEEAKSIYRHVEEQKAKDVGGVSAENIPAVNGHLSNDGVEETPPSRSVFPNASSHELEHRLDPADLFIDLTDENVAFKHFHPVPVTQNGSKLAGQSGLGGVWEWTSSPLEKHDGFKAMDLYPGYTSDFFDGKHNVVLGGSWATHPRIAGRKTFINWYQRNYPYAWVGARLVRDV